MAGQTTLYGGAGQRKPMIARQRPRQTLVAPEFTGPWTPLRLGVNLFGYWDADVLSTMSIVDTNRVAEWRSIVGGHAPAQASAGARPEYSATGFNGKPTVLFEGINYHLTLDAVPFPTGASPCEVWALVDQTALPADVVIRTIFAYGDLLNVGRRMGRAVVTVNRARAYTGTGASNSNATDATVDFTGRHIVRYRYEAARTGVGVDGGAVTYNGAVPATSTFGRTRIGSNEAATSGLRWQGSIRVILVTWQLTTQEAADTLAWMQGKM